MIKTVITLSPVQATRNEITISHSTGFRVAAGGKNVTVYATSFEEIGVAYCKGSVFGTLPPPIDCIGMRMVVVLPYAYRAIKKLVAIPWITATTYGSSSLDGSGTWFVSTSNTSGGSEPVVCFGVSKLRILAPPSAPTPKTILPSTLFTAVFNRPGLPKGAAGDFRAWFSIFQGRPALDWVANSARFPLLLRVPKVFERYMRGVLSGAIAVPDGRRLVVGAMASSTVYIPDKLMTGRYHYRIVRGTPLAVRILEEAFGGEVVTRTTVAKRSENPCYDFAADDEDSPYALPLDRVKRAAAGITLRVSAESTRDATFWRVDAGGRRGIMQATAGLLVFGRRETPFTGVPFIGANAPRVDIIDSPSDRVDGTVAVSSRVKVARNALRDTAPQSAVVVREVMLPVVCTVAGVPLCLVPTRYEPAGRATLRKPIGIWCHSSESITAMEMQEYIADLVPYTSTYYVEKADTGKCVYCDREASEHSVLYSIPLLVPCVAFGSYGELAKVNTVREASRKAPHLEQFRLPMRIPVFDCGAIAAPSKYVNTVARKLLAITASAIRRYGVFGRYLARLYMSSERAHEILYERCPVVAEYEDGFAIPASVVYEFMASVRR